VDPTTCRNGSGNTARWNAQPFASLRDSFGRLVSEPEVALRVQIAQMRALPVPWESPMPDFRPGRVDPKLVAEAAVRRMRSLVPALEKAELSGMARELGRLVRVMDAFARITPDEVGWSRPVLAVLDEASER